MAKIQAAIHPDDDYHYDKLGIRRGEIQLWEDGMRTDGSKGTYEWWYFDSHYPDGTILVLQYYSKSPIQVDGPIKPIVTAELTLPDGREYFEQIEASLSDSYYGKDMCDVRIGNSFIRGDLKHYDMVFKGEKIQAAVSLTNTVPAWRSQCGPILFGDKEEYYFNWLPATPEGIAIADVTYPEGQLHLEGSGYHDHNWGNIFMLKLMHHWYWGRAKIGDYKVISSWITAEKKYGYKETDVFMLAKGGEILGDNTNHTLKFLPEDEYIDQHTGKPVYNKVVYEYETPAGEFYRITYHRKGDISKQNFVDRLLGPMRILAKLIGFAGSYLRFEGKLYIQTGKVKPTSRQLLENPKAEICAFHQGAWVRIAGELLEDDRVEARASMLDAYPSLRKMYDENDGNTQVFYFKNATATFSSFSAAPETVEF